MLKRIPPKVQEGLAVIAFVIGFAALMLYTGQLLGTPGFP